MENYFKIGFHGGGIGGNHRGIGEYFSNGHIPVFKSVSSGGILHEALEKSNGRCVLVYRAAIKLQGSDYDPGIPYYHMDPNEAAHIHWQETKKHLEKDKPPREAWVQVMNEPDKNRADWLADVSRRIAEKAMAEGWKTLHLGWSTGEPEPYDWDLPYMRQFLDFAAENNDMVGIALNEYSLADDFSTSYPHLIGRFREILKRKSGVRIFIGEFGWHQDKAPKWSSAQIDLDMAQSIYGAHPEVMGAALWCLQSWHAPVYNTIQTYIAPITDWSNDYNYNGPLPEPIESGTGEQPVGECGKARVPYNRVYNRVSKEATKEQWLEICARAWERGETVGRSADDAGIGTGLGTKTVIEWGHEYPKDTIDAWYRDNYCVDNIEHRELPAQTPPDMPPPPPPTGASKPLFGLHLSADRHNMDIDKDLVYAAKPGMLKFLSGHDDRSVSMALEAFKPQSVVIRAFLDFGGRNVTPTEFFNWTVGDVTRTANIVSSVTKDIIIELHNEPNLTMEGLGSSWHNGTEFAQWYLDVLYNYRSALPDYKYAFPGLSPGSGNAIRYNHTNFRDQAHKAITSSDYLAVHSYWSSPDYPMNGNAFSGIPLVKEATVYGKPIVITEASNNNRNTQPDEKAREYIKFWQELHNIRDVKGVCYFVTSASNPAWGWNSGSGEIWTLNMAKAVGQR